MWQYGQQDDVQKAPNVLNVVHGLIEDKRGYQFILTGSSSRKLKKEGVNLLGGRVLLRHMPPFFAGELGKAFELDRNINVGMLPIVLDSPFPIEKPILESFPVYTAATPKV
ncbi:MAG: AAA family ATPase [Chlamydiales bacterium]